MLTACKTQKTATESSSIAISGTSVADQQLYISKVRANAPTVNDIVSKIDFTIAMMDKEVSTGGKLQMRRDKMVRISLNDPIMGLMEVGKLEFTPENVLIVDRINKQYVRATYSDLDFLRNNGIDFYTLQALFWNELFVPGNKHMTESLAKDLAADLKTADRSISYNKDNFRFSWATNPQNASITTTSIVYGKGSSNESAATWNYGSFANVGGKLFPALQNVSFTSKAFNGNSIRMDIKMGKVSTDSSWDAESTVSSKYKQVSAEEILRKLVSM